MFKSMNELSFVPSLLFRIVLSKKGWKEHLTIASGVSGQQVVASTDLVQLKIPKGYRSTYYGTVVSNDLSKLSSGTRRTSLSSKAPQMIA